MSDSLEKIYKICSYIKDITETIDELSLSLKKEVSEVVVADESIKKDINDLDFLSEDLNIASGQMKEINGKINWIINGWKENGFETKEEKDDKQKRILNKIKAVDPNIYSKEATAFIDNLIDEVKFDKNIINKELQGKKKEEFWQDLFNVEIPKNTGSVVTKWTHGRELKSKIILENEINTDIH